VVTKFNQLVVLSRERILGAGHYGLGNCRYSIADLETTRAAFQNASWTGYELREQSVPFLFRSILKVASIVNRHPLALAFEAPKTLFSNPPFRAPKEKLEDSVINNGV
jgi:hypothetical protein